VVDESVTAPEITFVPDVLRMAPTSTDETVTPLPVMVIASSTVTLFEIASVASFATEVAPAVVPRAVLLLIATTPDVTVVLPAYVFAPESVRVLVAEVFFVNEPAPEITPDRVWFVDDAKTKLDDEPIVIACE
jgi:hypothetical protein